MRSAIQQRPRIIEKLAKALDVSPSWLQFGSEAIDKLDKAAIETAIALMKLPPTERDVYQAAISRAAKDKK